MSKALSHVVTLTIALPMKKVISLTTLLSQPPSNLKLGEEWAIKHAEILSIDGENGQQFDQPQLPCALIGRKSGDYQLFTGQTAHLGVRIRTQDWHIEVLTGLKQVKSVTLKLEIIDSLHAA